MEYGVSKENTSRRNLNTGTLPLVVKSGLKEWKTEDQREGRTAIMNMTLRRTVKSGNVLRLV